jgi:hypothetical protein
MLRLAVRTRSSAPSVERAVSWKQAPCTGQKLRSRRHLLGSFPGRTGGAHGPHHGVHDAHVAIVECVVLAISGPRSTILSCAEVVACSSGRWRHIGSAWARPNGGTAGTATGCPAGATRRLRQGRRGQQHTHEKKRSYVAHAESPLRLQENSPGAPTVPDAGRGSTTAIGNPPISASRPRAFDARPVPNNA